MFCAVSEIYKTCWPITTSTPLQHSAWPAAYHTVHALMGCPAEQSSIYRCNAQEARRLQMVNRAENFSSFFPRSVEKMIKCVRPQWFRMGWWFARVTAMSQLWEMQLQVRGGTLYKPIWIRIEEDGRGHWAQWGIEIQQMPQQSSLTPFLSS